MSVLIGLLLASGPWAVSAQPTGESYFHEGAQQYVAGNEAAARRAVQQGLAVAPSDPRLLALREKLRSRGRTRGRQDSSASNSQNRSQQRDRNSDEQSSGGEEPQRSDQRDASQTGEGEESSSQSQRREGAGADPSGASHRDADRVDASQRGTGGRPGDTLTRAQAERLLRALEGQERQLLRRLRTRSAERRPVEKDW